MTNELNMLELITSLFQELLHPLINLNASCDILNKKAPLKIDPILQELGKASGELKQEVHYIYGNARQVFDLKSPETVATQLHQKASQWRVYEENISYALEKLQRAISSGFTLEDPDLNAIMKETMFSTFENFQNLLRMIESLQTEDLLSQIKMRRQ